MPPVTTGASQQQIIGSTNEVILELEDASGNPGSSASAPPAAARPASPSTPYDRTPEEEELVYQIKGVSWLSVFASIVIAIFSFSIGINDGVLSLVGLGLEMVLDAISSLLVLWRFKNPKKKKFTDVEAALAKKLQRDALRERNSTIGIMIVFIVFGFALAVKSLIKLTHGHPADRDEDYLETGAVYSVWITACAAIVFGVLTIAKYELARRSGSTVLMKDAICSALGVILSLVVFFCSLFEEEGFWYADPVAALVIALMMFVEAFRTWRHLDDDTIEAHQQFFTYGVDE